LGLRGKKQQGNGEKYIMKNLIICSLTQYFGVIKPENEMGGACSTYGGEERRIQDFGGVT